MPVNVRLTIDPSAVVTLSDAEYADLARQGLVYSVEGGTLPSPPPSLAAVAIRTASRAAMRFDALELTAANSSGMSKSGAVLTATSPSTEGRVWTPVIRRAFRASGGLKAVKSGALSMFGLSPTAAGMDPGGGTADWLGVAYISGLGIVIGRAAAPGGNTTLVPESSITDGQTYTVSLVFNGSIHAVGNPSEFMLQATVTDASGAIVGTGQLFAQFAWFPGVNSFVVRVSGGGAVSDLHLSQSLGGDSSAPSAIVQSAYTARSAAERMAVRIPARPNGRLVMYMHGRGGSNVTVWNDSKYRNVFQVLLGLGYTIAFPNMGGDQWASPLAMEYLRDARDILCAELNLDRKVIALGSSMGGMTALSATARQAFGPGNVAAVIVTQPVCDINTVRGGFAEIDTLYPTAAAREAVNPMSLPLGAFANVPVLFFASPGDTTVPKASNTDAMRARLGTLTRNDLVTVTGNHEDPSEFQGAAVGAWVQAYVQ